MSVLGYSEVTVTALDGKKYTTDRGGFYEQTLVSNGMVVFVKLLNIGNGKTIAISKAEAIRCGIDQLATQNEIKAARKGKLEEPDEKLNASYFKKHPEIEEDVRLRMRMRSESVSSSPVTRVSDKPPAVTVTKAETPAKKRHTSRGGHTTAEMIAEEAAKFAAENK